MWLEEFATLLHRISRSSRRQSWPGHRRTRRREADRVRLHLEPLEDRVVPHIIWTGSGAGYTGGPINIFGYTLGQIEATELAPVDFTATATSSVPGVTPTNTRFAGPGDPEELTDVPPGLSLTQVGNQFHLTGAPDRGTSATISPGSIIPKSWNLRFLATEDYIDSFGNRSYSPDIGLDLEITIHGAQPDLVVNTLGDAPAQDSQTGDTDLVTPGIQCTLRSAITAADRRSILDAKPVITFNLPVPSAGGAPTINLTGALDPLTVPVVIDGTSQPSAGKVEIDGSGAGTGINGLVLQGGSSEVKGLTVLNFGGNGIVLTTGGLSPNGDTVSGCEIESNLGNGIVIDNLPDNTIGGTAAGAGNVISGNAKNGILVTGSAALRNKIQGNAIGTEKDRKTKSGNILNGILITDGAGNTTIGGPANTGADNVIAFNLRNGVLVGFDPANGFPLTSNPNFNAIQSNAIFGNGYLGIHLGTDGTMTPNADPNSTDLRLGPNLLVNYPEISVWSYNSSSVPYVRVAFHGEAFADYTLQFFATSVPDATGAGGGSRLIGATTATTDKNGNIAQDVLFPGVTFDISHEFVTGTATDSHNNTSEFSRPRNPILFVPGIGGSMPSRTQYGAWLLQRGFDPAKLGLEPLTRSYDDLLQTLVNVGYVVGHNLFKAVYDWRVLPGPIDGALDGKISGLTAQIITSAQPPSPTNPQGTYKFGVDYLGYWLKQAQQQWELDYPGLPVPKSVDVIAHSTGGLVVRSYIQSDAYQGSYVDDNGVTQNLPKIDHFIMMGVPNQGAAGPWLPLFDDWSRDLPTRIFLSALVASSYKKLLNGNSSVAVTGPDYNLNLKFIRDNSTDDHTAAELFIRMYCPTFESLLGTYPFKNTDSGRIVPDDHPNKLLMDLNGGNPNAFADNGQVDHVIDIYGTDQKTQTYVTPHVEPTAVLQLHTIVPAMLGPREIPTGETYFTYDFGLGDGTVPLISSVGQFESDPKVDKFGFEGITHTGMFSIPKVATQVLKSLGYLISNDQISTSLALGLTDSAISSWYVLNDPVQGFLVDANGKRLGFSQATGVLTEIPGSQYFGEEGGLGIVLGPVAAPVHVQLLGDNADYDVLVRGIQGNMATEVEDTGFLGQGVAKSIAAPLQAPGAVDRFAVEGPPYVATGSAFSITVTARDQAGMTNTSYLGTVHLAIPDGAAGVAQDYQFTAADQGTHTFSGLVLQSAGPRQASVSDSANAALAGSVSLLVSGPATHLSVQVPRTVHPGELTAIVVTALDAGENVAAGFTGNVRLSSTDASAQLPPLFPFPADAAGSVLFNIVLNNAGTQTVIAKDSSNSAIAGQADTTGGTSAPLQLSQLRRQYGFTFAGDYYLDSLGVGANEIWMLDRQQNWYVVLPDGRIQKWLGGTQLDTPIATVTPQVWQDPNLLFNAPLGQFLAATDQTQLATLREQNGFFSGGSYYQDALGMGGNEKWILDQGGNWFVIQRDGRLQQWLGGTSLGAPVATVNPLVWDDPTLLFEAKLEALLSAADQSQLSNLRVQNGFTSGGNYYQGSLGVGGNEKWILDKTGQWFVIQRDGRIQQWLGGTDLAGPLATVNAAVWNDPTLLLDAKLNLSPAAQAQLATLSQSHGFHAGTSDFFDYYGLGEKWFLDGHDNYFYIKPDGSIDAADSTPLAQVDPQAWDDPNLLFAAKLSATAQTQLQQLETQYGFYFTGDYSQGYHGLNAKWFRDAAGFTYVVLAAGTLQLWNGVIGGVDSFTTIAMVDPQVWSDPQLLFGA